MIKVLVVDDQVLFRGALRALLATMDEVEVVGEAADGNAAVRMAEELVPDVVVMDLTLPGIDGFQATQQIRQGHPAMAVLLLSGFADPGMRQQATRAGAASLLEKTALDRLLPAIRAAVAQA